MSNLEKIESHKFDTRETCKDSNEEGMSTQTQNVSWNESQDFHLIDTEYDELSNKDVGTGKTKLENMKDICQKPIIHLPLQRNSGILQCKTNNIPPDESVIDENVIKDESIKIAEEVSGNVHDPEKKDELSDNEDEIIQGTPPHIYSPSVKVISGNETLSLKRKAKSFNEPLTKIFKMTSMENSSTLQERFEEEGSRQSSKSDDSDEELSKNPGRDIIIEETQDPANEFTQNSSNTLAKRTEILDNNATQEYNVEELYQQHKKSFSGKCCDMDKNENLNVSTKLIENNANDRITATNSLHESNIQVEDNNLSETKENTTSSTITIDEKSEIDIQNETSESLQLKDIETVSDKETEQANCVESEIVNNDPHHEQEILHQPKICNELEPSIKTSLCKSRMSVEVIYDGSRRTIGCEDKSKPEIVEIDEDGEKIVLDSLEEDSEIKAVDNGILDNTNTETVYKNYYETKSNDCNYKSLEDTKESSLDSKSSNKLVNGSSESKRSDTISVESDTFSNSDIPPALGRSDGNAIASAHGTKGFGVKGSSFVTKDLDNIDLISISDNENDISNVDDNTKNKSDLIHNQSASAKVIQVEREIGIHVRLKCLLDIDESTKEFLSKELTAVHCEPTTESSSARQKNEDTSSSLADISDNKETSPGSVNSNPHLYHLNPSRLSIISTISSSSSASSAASLAAKLAMKDNMHFSLPRGPAKHAKKLVQDATSIGDKQAVDEAYERLINEWKNNRLLTTMILNCANAELGATDTHNVSNERLDDHHLQKMLSSTPEVARGKVGLITPKSTKRGKAMKRFRNGLMKSSIQTNGEDTDIRHTPLSMQGDNTPSRKKFKIDMEESKLLLCDTNVSSNSSPRDTLIDELIGKEVFAKWSDNNYYPGMVTDKVKTKYKVNFYDGKNKTLIPEFIIPIPKTLKEGLSVYATTKVSDYGSCGIIIDIQTTVNGVYYMVETDEGERLQVQVKNIFLSTDQAQVLKEEMTSGNKALLSTPKHLGQVTLDNMVEGKRRSKRIGTPIFSTPKSRSTASNSASKSTNSIPSVSGVSMRLKKESTFSENEGISSDSNVSIKDETMLSGVQNEINGTPHEQVIKGPRNKIKGKPRSKKKVEDEQTIALLGPIPQANSNIFKDMSFILTCASLETLDKYQDDKPPGSGTETETDNETENEEDWIERPFLRDRLQMQIITGGGKLYEDFDQIPKDEYKNTKLITNVPNTTAKSILCLSVGIPTYNHKWIIRCCLEGKIVNPAENALPNGWSLQRRAYVEMFQTLGNKPLTEMVVIIPSLLSDRFSIFWRQVCENAGAVVLVVEDPGVMETMDLDSDIVIVSNQRCPTWAVERAKQFQIPLLSTTWIIQCLIEGKVCEFDRHPRYKYNYIS